jgi:hypothetical protein
MDVDIPGVARQGQVRCGTSTLASGQRLPPGSAGLLTQTPSPRQSCTTSSVLHLMHSFDQPVPAPSMPQQAMPAQACLPIFDMQHVKLDNTAIRAVFAALAAACAANPAAHALLLTCSPQLSNHHTQKVARSLRPTLRPQHCCQHALSCAVTMHRHTARAADRATSTIHALQKHVLHSSPHQSSTQQ